jgi:predicted Zn-ribbon and HTH transcriptional regulator
MNICNNLCTRYRKVTKKKTGYSTGLIAYCTNCTYMFFKEDIKMPRCPCCKSIMRTHSRSRKLEVKRI